MAGTTEGGRLRRVEFRIEGQGLVEGGVPSLRHQALVPFLTSRKGTVEVAEASSEKAELQGDNVTLKSNNVLWARALDSDTALTVALPGRKSGTGHLVELTLPDDEVLQGRIVLSEGQKLAQYLASANGYIPLISARSLSDGRELGGVAVNSGLIQFSRQLANTSPEAEDSPELNPDEASPEAPEHSPGWLLTGSSAWQPPASGGAQTPPARRSHRLISEARYWGFSGLDDVDIREDAPLARVWDAIARAASITQQTLAERIAARLGLGVADVSGARPLNLSPALQELETRLGVKVLEMSGRTVRVATADPLDLESEQLLGFAAGRRVTMLVAPPEALGLSAPDEPADSDLDLILESLPQTSMDEVEIEEREEPEEVRIGDASSEPIVQLADAIVQEAIRQGASDVHLEPSERGGLVRMRVDGVLHPHLQIPHSALQRLVSRYKIMARMDIADRMRPQDGQVKIRVGGNRYALRISTVPTQDSEKAVLRIAGGKSQDSLDQIAIPDEELTRIRRILAHRDGIIIVTGPTGSGKTTTLYAALRELNTGGLNIVTVEDPVERNLAGATQIQVQPKQGVTFASALRAVLRQDPDVVLVGEIRDLETAEIALRAAMTGHLVLTTLHTTSAVGVVPRLRDLGLDLSALAASLRGVVAQRLVRGTCKSCAGKGCSECAETGLRGRIPVMEVLEVDSNFGELIARGGSPAELKMAALRAKMKPIRQVAMERARLGETSESEIFRVLGETEAESEAIEPPPSSPAPVEAKPTDAKPEPAPKVVDSSMPVALEPGTIDLPQEGEEARVPAPAAVAEAPSSEAPMTPAVSEAESPARPVVAAAEDSNPSAAPESEAPSRPLVAEAESPAKAPASEAEEPLPSPATVPSSVQTSFDDGIARAQDVREVLGWAADRISGLFQVPLAWGARVRGSSLQILAHSQVFPRRPDGWEGYRVRLGPAEGPMVTAIRSGQSASGPLTEQKGLGEFEASAQALDLGGFVALPIPGADGTVAIIGVHTRTAIPVHAPIFEEVRRVLGAVGAAIRRLLDLESARLQLSAFESTADSVLILDKMGRIQWVNRAFTDLTGYEASSALGQSPNFLRSDRHNAAFHQAIRETVLAGRSWRGEIFNRRMDGTIHPVEQTITPVLSDGIPTSFICVQRDISERVRRDEEVARMALQDSETGLPNGRHLIAELTQRASEMGDGDVAAFLLIRLHVDPELAKWGSDEATSESAAISKAVGASAALIRQTLRPADFLGRLGEDELAAILPGTDLSGARIAARRISEVFDLRSDGAPERPAGVRVSVGISGIDRTRSTRTIIASADAQIYRAIDEEAPNENATYGSGEASLASERWMKRISDALQQDDFFLHFQPVIRLGSGEVDHFCALLRLYDEDGSVIPARSFIAHAEESGSIRELDRWVVNQAIQLLRASPEMKISVNLSARTLLDPDFGMPLVRDRARLELVGSRLTFEVPVSEELLRDERAKRHMEELAKLGCRFALDNVGMDPMAIACLGALPAQLVKVDGSLISGIADDPVAREMTSALVKISQGLGREVIGCRAETSKVVEALPTVGIGLAEGHQLGRPSSNLASANGADDSGEEQPAHQPPSEEALAAG